jgi:hypothetical protein
MIAPRIAALMLEAADILLRQKPTSGCGWDIYRTLTREADFRSAVVAIPEGVEEAEFEERVTAYLPWNYRVMPGFGMPGKVAICGVDLDGWTLDGYVLPRLASGLMVGVETQPLGTC